MDKLENLKKLKQLFDNGVLSEKEFFELKNEILSKVDGEIKSSRHLNFEQNIESKQIKNGFLTVSFDGQSFTFDAETKLFINDELHSKHSTINGFSVEIPILSDKMEIKVVLMSIKTTIYELEELDKSKDYFFGLIYDNVWGRYSDKINLTRMIKVKAKHSISNKPKFLLLMICFAIVVYFFIYYLYYA